MRCAGSGRSRAYVLTIGLACVVRAEQKQQQEVGLTSCEISIAETPPNTPENTTTTLLGHHNQENRDTTRAPKHNHDATEKYS